MTESQKRQAETIAQSAWSLWRQRKLGEAEKLFERAVSLDPRNANAFNGLGWSQFNQGKAANAKLAFEAAIAIEPDHPAALNGLGWIAKGQNKLDDAIAYWQKAVTAAPTATAAINGLATTYAELGQYDKAAQYYRMLLKAQPNEATARSGLDKVTKADAATKSAITNARNWLAIVDDADYARSWEQAAAVFKAAVTSAKWGAAVKAVRTPLGKLLSRRVLSAKYATSLPGAPDGEYVVIQFEASFENKKNAIETVTPMKDADGKWRVSGYYIK